MRDRIITAVNSVEALFIEASSGGTATVNLEHYRYTEQGNTTSSDDFTPLGNWSIGNMTGGVDGWVFEETGSTPFAIGTNEGDIIVIVDPTNPENNGAFVISKVISTSKVQLDFRGNPSAGDSFTAATGLTWFMFGTDYQNPSTNGDYFRLDAPSGWSIQFTRQVASSILRFDVTVATDGDWSGSNILGTSNPALLFFSQSVAWSFNVYFDDVNDTLFIFETGQPISNTYNFYNSGMIAARVDPFEDEVRDSHENVVLFGTYFLSFGFPDYIGRQYTGSKLFGLGRGRVIVDGTEVDAVFVDLTYSDANQSFTRDYEWETNVRVAAASNPWEVVGKAEIQEGLIVLIDPDNSDGLFEFLGTIKGVYLSRGLHEISANVEGPTDGRPHWTFFTISQDSTNDKLYLYDGVVIDWPGVYSQV
jgi:hypothetical protein